MAAAEVPGLTHPLFIAGTQAGPGFEGLETLIILEAYFKEKDTKFKI